MDSTAMMTILATRAAAGEAQSALPDAPVVADVERDVATAFRTRAVIAAALHRLGDVVAPPRAAVCAE
jgi:hypothetical protein